MRRLAIGVLGALVLTMPAVAAAGTPGSTESLGKSKGLEYMRAQHPNVIDQVGQSAYCDGDAEVTGGGGVINGPAPGTALHETYPDTGDLSGWRAEASTAGDEPRRLTTFAVCGGVDLNYSNSQIPLDTGILVANETCSSSVLKPIGGGMSATGSGMKLVASRPVRPPSTPGWAVNVWNDTMDDTLIDSYGICTDRFKLRDRTSELNRLQPGETGTAIAKCKSSESVLSGGFVGRRDKVTGFLTVALGTKPWDSKADGNKVPDDGWQVRARNQEDLLRADLEAIAVCKRGLVPIG